MACGFTRIYFNCADYLFTESAEYTEIFIYH